MAPVHLQATIGVKAVILRDDQLLTVVKQYPEGTAYILPGGSQEHGEPLDHAIRRECREELGTDVVVGALLFVREYIGANHAFAALDRDLHIVDILFACSVPEDYVPRLGPEPDADQIGVQWLPIESLHHYRFYPAALQSYLRQRHRTGIYVGDVN